VHHLFPCGTPAVQVLYLTEPIDEVAVQNLEVGAASLALLCPCRLDCTTLACADFLAMSCHVSAAAMGAFRLCQRCRNVQESSRSRVAGTTLSLNCPSS
jgi:hypothetical protein